MKKKRKRHKKTSKTFQCDACRRVLPRADQEPGTDVCRSCFGGYERRG